MRLHLAGLLVALLLTPVAASAAPFSVSTTNDPTTLLNALLGATTGLSGFSLTANGAPEAFGTFAGDDPFGGIAPGVVIGTGFVSELVGPNNVNPSTPGSSSDLDQDLGLFGTDGDDTTLSLTFSSDGTAPNLSFNYVFASEEFPEYIGSEFNDQFTLILNGIDYAFLACGQAVAINNFVGACSAELVSNPGDVTPIDGWSKPLTFSAPLQTGLNTLEIRVRDVSDGVFDSAVFIQGGTVGTGTPQVPPGGGEGEPSPVPEPGTVALLGSGLGALVFRRIRQMRH